MPRLAAAAFAVAAVLCSAPAAAAQSSFNQDPVIFVHGSSGSGAQFESQKMRFTSNGYPERYITVLEYDSTFATEPRSEVFAKLDRLVAELKTQTGRSKVDILGHSLGTSVMQEYLTSSPSRAANVAHYVNIDGRQADAPPGGVPTLAIWAGRGAPDRAIKGARNVTIPNQTHVQSATSAESFAAFYEFFTGRAPSTSAIVPETGRIQIEGRALLFPQNRGGTATALEIWAIDGATGQRAGSEPEARVPIDREGAWGPVPVEAGRYYELALVRPGGVTTLHYYYEPFVRSDHLVRLLYSDAIEALVERGERHVGTLVIRYKELWGDQAGQNDVLTYNGANVCNPAICPIDKLVNAVFAFDRRSDGRTDLSAPDPVFSRLPFITGADVFMPAARPPTGTTSVSLRSRDGGPARTLNFPNFASTTDGASLYFNDFEEPVPAAAARRGCLNSRGGVRGKRLGPARLGRTRARQRRLLRGKRLKARAGMDRYCVAGGGSFRIGYPTARLSRRERARARGRVILIVTSSGRFAVRGVRPGATIRALRQRLRGERRTTVGRNVWYLAPGRAATLAYKTRGRRVLAVGLADRRLTGDVRASRRFLRSWELRR